MVPFGFQKPYDGRKGPASFLEDSCEQPFTF